MLWEGLGKWANETNGGAVRASAARRKDKGHYLVAEALGQCLLRRADLDKLRTCSPNTGDPTRNRTTGDDSGKWSTRCDVRCTGGIFTTHSVRVLDDLDRLDAAWGQIRPNISDSSRKSASKPHPGDALPAPEFDGVVRDDRSLADRQAGAEWWTLQARGRSAHASDRRSFGEVLRRCYLRLGRVGSKPPHKPPHEDFLLATTRR